MLSQFNNLSHHNDSHFHKLVLTLVYDLTSLGHIWPDWTQINPYLWDFWDVVERDL